MTTSCWPAQLPAEFDLVAITDRYPLEDMLAESRGLWGRFKRALGKTKPPVAARPRREWFTVYEEAGKGFVIFEDREIRRILLLETSEDAADLAGCRIVLQLFNDVHVTLRDLKSDETVEFYQRFLSEVRKMCSTEPQSRKPHVFLQDVISVEARLNGLFYQALCSVYGEICRLWRSKDPAVQSELAQAQDRVIELWKRRPPAPAWKECLDESKGLLERARAWAANPPRRKSKALRNAADVNSIGGLLDEAE